MENVRILSGNRLWFDLGMECEILSQNLLAAMQKAEGEVKLSLSEELQKLYDLVENVMSEDIKEAQVVSVRNSIHTNYKKLTLMKVENKEEAVVSSSSVNTSPRSRKGEEEK